MDTTSEPSWDDVEAVLYQEWIEEQALLAVLEAMGQLDESDEAVAAKDEAEDEFFFLAFPLDERTWGNLSLNDLWVDDLSFRFT
jgi:hypothetical protein